MLCLFIVCVFTCVILVPYLHPLVHLSPVWLSQFGSWPRWVTSDFLNLFSFFFKFIYLFWESVCMSRGRAERGRERIPSRLCSVSTEPDEGLDLRTAGLQPEPMSRIGCDWATRAPPASSALSHLFPLCKKVSFLTEDSLLKSPPVLAFLLGCPHWSPSV